MKQDKKFYELTNRFRNCLEQFLEENSDYSMSRQDAADAAYIAFSYLCDAKFLGETEDGKV